MSAGLKRESGMRMGNSMEGAKAADWAAQKMTSLMALCCMILSPFNLVILPYLLYNLFVLTIHITAISDYTCTCFSGAQRWQVMSPVTTLCYNWKAFLWYLKWLVGWGILCYYSGIHTDNSHALLSEHSPPAGSFLVNLARNCQNT